MFQAITPRRGKIDSAVRKLLSRFSVEDVERLAQASKAPVGLPFSQDEWNQRFISNLRSVAARKGIRLPSDEEELDGFIKGC